jgi:RNase P/RNase MRP subunit POP5
MARWGRGSRAAVLRLSASGTLKKITENLEEISWVGDLNLLP